MNALVVTSDDRDADAARDADEAAADGGREAEDVLARGRLDGEAVEVAQRRPKPPAPEPPL